MSKIKLTKCKPESVRQTLELLGLDVDGSLKVTVERLSKFYAGASSLDIAGCDICNADSDASLDACPFCATKGDVVDDIPPTQLDLKPDADPKPDVDPKPEPEAPPPTRSKAKAAKAKPKKGNCVACEGTGESSNGNVCSPCGGTGSTKVKAPATKAKAPATKAKKAPATKATKAPATKAKAPATKAKKAPATKAKKAPATKAKAPATKTKKAAPKVKKPADAVETAAIVTVADLDTQVEVIKQCVTDGALALHRLGAAAKTINDSGLWKMRITKGGTSCYRSFKQFCVEDLGMSPQHIYRAINTTEQFTEQEVKGLSGKQIRVVMQLPKEAQKDALSAAKDGEGTSALSDRAKVLGDKGADAPVPAKAVTVAVVMGIQKVALYKRPKKNAKVCDPETAEVAKSISDKPWLAIELKNKVRLLVRLDQNKKGELVGTVEFRRGDPAI